MMKAQSSLALGVSLGVLATAGVASAQDATQSQAEDAVNAMATEIIVTARRKEENLLDVPESVAVVSAQQVEKYNVLRMTDVQKLIPGLTLSDSGGYGQNTSMRGITFDQVQALPQTVAFYLNDVLVRPQHAYMAMFDVGQIEVLRGPQGTLRGEISPSGAITITTRRPDLDEFGGYVSGSAGNLHNSNLQAAVGVPIVPGKLAIRVAGLRDVTDAGGIRSVFTSVKPHEESKGIRGTLRFEPSDAFSAVITYQHIDKLTRSYGSVYGSGAAAVPTNPNFPAGFNGPPIGVRDRLSVAPGPTRDHVRGDLVQAQFAAMFAGQKLSYTGGYAAFRTNTGCETVANTSPLPCLGLVTTSREHDWSHEIRLSSAERLFDHFDYTLGYFHINTQVPTTVALSPNFLSGGLGSPLSRPSLSALNTRFAVRGALSSVPASIIEDGLFGSLTYHITDRTELTGGVRWQNYRRHTVYDITFLPAFIGLGIPQSFCGQFGGSFGASYPGICDFPVNVAPFHFDNRDQQKPWIYNFELSHKLTDDLMVYGRFGNSFRAGSTSLSVLSQTRNPALEKYMFPGPEKSKSYEVGLKGSLFDRKFQFEVDYYHQTFDGYLYYTLPTYFLVNDPGVTPSVSSTNFTANAPAKVDGVEFTASAFFSRNFSITGNVAWTNGRLSNALIPCNLSSARPTVAQFQAAGQSVFTCRSNASTSVAPKLAVTVQSEYNHPITDGVNAFVRALASYKGRNPNSSNFYVVPAYTIVDLHLGLRSNDGRWELDAYSKNLLNNKTITAIGLPGNFGGGLDALIGTTTGTGYSTVSLTGRREFGATLRYAFGSR